jgi:uncharacterized repeat protein (TIGR01451 family)
VQRIHVNHHSITKSPSSFVARTGKVLSNATSALLNTLLLLASIIFSCGGYAATPPNTPVINTATATFKTEGKTLSVSATSAINTSARTPATIQLLGAVSAQHQGATATPVNPGACLVSTGSGKTWQPQSTMQTIFGGNLNTPTAVNTVVSRTFSGRDALLVAVLDPDQNRDPLRLETLVVEVVSTSDRETLQLTETGPSTGYFVGWIQLSHESVVIGDCRLSVSVNDTVNARYTDIQDTEDVVAGAALVDPYGTVFNSQTGAPVNGALVRIFDAITGQPATVYGDDGVSGYPNVYLTGRDVSDSSGLLYSAGVGRYRFPLVAPGVYRLEVSPPEGYSFPSTILDNSITKTINEAYAIGVGAKGEAFPVPIGPAVRIDIPIDPRLGNLLINKTSNRVQAAVGDLVRYEISLRNSDPAVISDITLYDQLPVGLRLRAGSIKDSTGKPLVTVQETDGRRFRVDIGSLEGASSYRFSYLVEITTAAQNGKAINHAYAAGTGARSEPANATIQIVDDLMLSRAVLIGTVFEGRCPNDEDPAKPRAHRGVQSARIVLHDGRYANTDVNGQWHIEGIKPGTTMVRLDRLSLPKGQIVLPCLDDPRRSAGSLAKTLDVQPGSLNRVDFYTQPSNKNPTNNTNSHQPKLSAAQEPKVVADQISAAEQVAWQRKSSALAWAYPEENFAPPDGYQSFLLVHQAGQRVVLEHQGKSVAGFHYEGSKTGLDGQIATSLWRNVHLQNGANRFVARVFDRDNNQVDMIEKVLHLATSPVRAELVAEGSRLVANGRDPATIAIRLFDDKDQPVRKDITGEFSLNEPYVIKDVADAVAKNALAPIVSPASRYVVGQDGIALITLAPTTQSGEVEISFNFSAGRTQTLRAWLQADQREWIVVGFAEGSPVGSKLREKMQAASGASNPSTEIHGERIALYAKGTIAGDVLLTLAYDSAKQSTDIGNQPQAIPLANFYTVYSDYSQGGAEAQTRGKLFLKIEKSSFLALLGNSNTGLTTSELGRYAQAMYGLKSTWQADRFSYTAFAMRNLTSFHRDIIRADGTTGSWPLSRQIIVPNTDQVRVVTRNRLDAGNILSERSLARTTDYSIDYLSGRLQLAQPVPTFDGSLNPVTIEVEFSSESFSTNGHTLGGRFAYKPTNQIELGLTYVEDNDTAKGGHLAAVDLNAKLAPGTALKVEAGQSNRIQTNGKVSGSARLVELRHDRPDLNGRVYYRRTGPNYGLADQPVGNADLKSYGAEVRAKLSDTLQIESQLSEQERISTTQTAAIAQAKLIYADKAWQATLGFRVGLENNGQGVSSKVNQLLATAGYLSPDQRWSLRIGAEVGSEQGAQLFPNRLLLEGDYRMTPNMAITTSQSWILADKRTSETSVGLRYTPWAGAEMQLGMNQRRWGEGENTAVRTSLVQTSKLNSYWALNAQISGARRVSGSAFVPLPTTTAISNADDFTTSGFTLSYNSEPWSAYLRAEKRWANDGRYLLASGVSHKLDAGQHLLSTIRIERLAADDKASVQLTLAHALRRQNSPWSVLNRLDLIDSQRGTPTNSSIPSSAQQSQTSIGANSVTTGKRLLISSHWNYLSSTTGLEWLNRVGYKRVLESHDQSTYGTSFAIIGSEVRRPINQTLDVGIHAVHARSFSSPVSNTGYGVNVGLKIVPNTLITVGYNLRGIKDRDFYAGNQRAAGAFIWVKLLLDENLLGLSRSTAAMLAESK